MSARARIVALGDAVSSGLDVASRRAITMSEGEDSLAAREALGHLVAEANRLRVPRTKLWGSADAGYLIVLECECGAAVDYPGHPDERDEVICENCHAVWKVG